LADPDFSSSDSASGVRAKPAGFNPHTPIENIQAINHRVRRFMVRSFQRLAFRSTDDPIRIRSPPGGYNNIGRRSRLLNRF
jgi:hypothetical protein